MPTYEYECKKCEKHFELFQSIKDEPLKICPECGSEVRRLINGGGGIIYKGSGFYNTDSSACPEKSGDSKKDGKEKAAPEPVACSCCPAKNEAGACPKSPPS